ncbi:single-stranded-DNA-specific exonuclease RecJ [Desulfonatronum thiosulfatophilum]|uniref:single-stranded-DNA-specific exonuclease RecJ n=1 Tax=Desulfonatronum thiosulfatophilum TaxID=617002 RepID=UPI001FC95D33|nr:single-stranded-DNA-specific exonuclease RecJ [Desulfonatronum thiosulfatophilum]
MRVLSGELDVSPLVVRLLWTRGLRSTTEMDLFLSPRIRDLAHPDQWHGLTNAAKTISQALASGQKPVVWGDYDVDGITGTALLLLFFRARGIFSEHYIPSRQTEGYGLNCSGIEALASRDIKLLITVDCGISHIKEVVRAKELGMTVVISDHHLPGPELPPADAIMNPKIGECPCSTLAGVGVAFFLAAVLNRMLPGEHLDMRQFLDLVALGTIADIVELTGQNRILAKNGLTVLKDGLRPGIFALKEVCGYKPSAVLDEDRVGFGLAPRINAAGRLGKAETALRLLLTEDLNEARELAKELDGFNVERRGIGREIQDEALRMALEQQGRFGLVLHAPHWHEGVIGIIASKVAETHYRPTIILTDDESGALKGSGRSIPEFSLYDGLQACEHLLLGFGGHSQAAGLRLHKENLDLFRDAFNAVVARKLNNTPPKPTLILDAPLSFGEIDYDLLKELELLAPFGADNPKPLFISPQVVVRKRKPVGVDHVFLDLRDEIAGVTMRAKAWNQAKALPQSITGKSVYLAYTPKFNEFNGVTSIELALQDWSLQG